MVLIPESGKCEKIALFSYIPFFFNPNLSSDFPRLFVYNMLNIENKTCNRVLHWNGNVATLLFSSKFHSN